MNRSELATTKGEETRERIVDAALKLFREQGFDQTTMRDVAAEDGALGRERAGGGELGRRRVSGPGRERSAVLHRDDGEDHGQEREEERRRATAIHGAAILTLQHFGRLFVVGR